MAELRINLVPFPWQERAQKMLRNDTRICVARQTGKTTLLKQLLFGVGLNTTYSEYGYITPTLKRSGEVFRSIVEILPRGMAEIRKVDKQIVFHDRMVTFHFGSTEQAKGHRGGTWMGVIFDECQLMDGAIIRQTFLPMLSATAGWRVYCGTPPDLLEAPDPYFFENLMAEGCSRFGVDVNDEGEWADDEICVVHHGHKIRSAADPNYKHSVDQARGDTPEDEFEREYGARFTKPGEGQLKVELLKDYGTWAGLRNVPMDVRIHLDPSFSEQEASDPRAMVCAGLSADGDLNILDIRRGRWDYPGYLEQFWSMAEWVEDCGWKVSYVSVETNGPGAYFLQTLRRSMEVKSKFFPIQPRHHAKSKYERVLTLSPWLRDGRLAVQMRRAEYVGSTLERVGDAALLNPGTQVLLQEMKDFPRGLLNKKVRMLHHYDVLDALSHSTQDFLPPPRRSEKTATTPSGKLILSFSEDIRKAKMAGHRKKRGWFHA